jgi:hypothetical protein
MKKMYQTLSVCVCVCVRERERERERDGELFTPHFPGSFHDQRDEGYKKE